MSTMYQHILIPVDLTDKNQMALDVANQIARQSTAKVTLLHVIETIEFADDDEIRGFYDMLEAKAQEKLQLLSQGMRQDGLLVDHDIVFGKRASRIVAYCMEKEVDLVVFGSHRIDLKRPHEGWDTLSYQVSILCPCHVLLVK